jgi:hypothetical protein
MQQQQQQQPNNQLADQCDNIERFVVQHDQILYHLEQL